MAKNVILFVKGDDYSALNFEQNFKAQEVYEQMIKEGVSVKTYESDEYYIDVYIKEFQDVDPKFIEFVRDELHDYDSAKHYDFYEVNYTD
jgi:hypothetical protein